MSIGFYSVTENWVHELGRYCIWRSGTMGYIMLPETGVPEQDRAV
jgi:hypothetical protein